jgi:N-acetylmuramoyl-L-alanine amidase
MSENLTLTKVGVKRKIVFFLGGKNTIKTVLVGFAALALFLITTISAYGSTKNHKAKHLYGMAVKNYYILNSSKQKQQYRDTWLNVINEFEQVYKDYPKSSYAPKALYNIGNLYNNLYTRSFLDKDLNAGINAFKRLQQQYKDNTLADDALFKIAEIYRTKKGDTETALRFYELILEDYPNSNSAPMAKIWVKKLGGSITVKQPAHAKKIAGVLNGIKVWSAGDYTRVVLNVSNEVIYSGHLLEQTDDNMPGKRIYIDLKGTMLTCDTPPISVKDGIVEEVRAGQFNSNTARVVLDVGNIDDYSIFNLEDPFRIIIDVKGKKTAEENNVENEKLSETTAEQATEGTVPKGLSISKIIKDYENINKQTQPAVPVTDKYVNNGLFIKKIVIDPGHGGHDPGAIGPNGIMEKNITLKIGTMLADKLRAMGFHVIMTRDKDVFIPLEERTAIANMSNADIFISIHANASLSHRTRGITTYYLSTTHDRASMLVAARENATSTKKLSDLQLILEDLMKTAKINESALFASDVQKNMVESLRKDGYNTPNLGVRSAPFFVLMHANMPSILIETSFVTNPTEERLLEERRYEQSIVDGVVKGILQYGTKLKMAEQ